MMAEIEFRDGKRVVPDHVAALMAGIETYKFTHAEAIEEMNRKAEQEYVQERADRLIANHLKVHGH